MGKTIKVTSIKCGTNECVEMYVNTSAIVCFAKGADAENTNMLLNIGHEFEMKVKETPEQIKDQIEGRKPQRHNTNLERMMDEIKKHPWIERNGFAMVGNELKRCDETSCRDCKFRNDRAFCNISVVKWLAEECGDWTVGK